MKPRNNFEPLDQFNFHHRLSELSGLAIIIFTGPACGSCRTWKELLSRFSETRKQLSLFEVDVEQDAALAAEFPVFHLPAIFLYIDGNFHASVQCEASQSALSDTIDVLLKAAPQETP